MFDFLNTKLLKLLVAVTVAASLTGCNQSLADGISQVAGDLTCQLLGC